MWSGFDRCSARGVDIQSTNNPGNSQQETLAEIEHISTIAGSLVSIASISHTHTQVRYVSITTMTFVWNH